PFLAREFQARVAFALAHGEARLRLVGRGGGVGEAADAAVTGRTGAEMELVADPAGDRLAIRHRGREIGAEPAIGARRAGVPARPHQRIAAPEAEAEPSILVGLWVVGAGRIAGDYVIEQVEDALRTAIGHVVDQDAAAAQRV